jgi:hypothetical protein
MKQETREALEILAEATEFANDIRRQIGIALAMRWDREVMSPEVNRIARLLSRTFRMPEVRARSIIEAAVFGPGDRMTEPRNFRIRIASDREGVHDRCSACQEPIRAREPFVEYSETQLAPLLNFCVRCVAWALGEIAVAMRSRG